MDNIPKVTIRNRESNQNISHSYDFWLDRFVEKGIAHNYDIIEYPDLAELIILNENGIEVRRKHILIENAVNLSKDNPSKYDFKRVNIEELKKEHLEKSRKIANIKPIIKSMKKVFYFLSFLFIIPFFSKTYRVYITRYINENINVIMVVGVILTLAFAAIQTLKMFNIV